MEQYITEVSKAGFLLKLKCLKVVFAKLASKVSSPDYPFCSNGKQNSKHLCVDGPLTVSFWSEFHNGDKAIPKCQVIAFIFLFKYFLCNRVSFGRRGSKET